MNAQIKKQTNKGKLTECNTCTNARTNYIDPKHCIMSHELIEKHLHDGKCLKYRKDGE